MATATKSKNNRVKVQKTLSDLNSALIKNSEEIIDGTIKTGERYQKLFAKTLKKGEPVINKQVDIVFDTLEGIKGQFEYGGSRFRKLIGWDDNTITNWRKDAEKRVNNFRKQAEDRIEDIQEDLGFKTASKKKPVRKAEKTLSAKKVAPKKKAVKKVVTDLKVIDGIGPAMERILKAAGIKSVNDLATSATSKLSKIVEGAGPRFRMIDASTWVKQAKQVIK